MARLKWMLLSVGLFLVPMVPLKSADWSFPPTDLSDSGGTASTPQVVIDSIRGSAIAVWRRFNGADNIIQVSLYDGSTWSAPISLSDPGGNATAPQVVIDSMTGNAIAIWRRFDGMDAVIQVSLYEASTGTWSTPVDLSAPGQSADFPQVAIDSATGNAIAIWVRFDGEDNIVQASIYSEGSWTPLP